MLQMSFGLALGGGGARGLAHIEFLKVLDDLGIKPSVISGTSIGAIVGAFYATGMSGREIEQLVDKLNFLKIGSFFFFFFLDITGLIKGKGVERFFRENLPIKSFEELPIKLKIVAADFWNREEIIFNQGDLIKAIRSSMSVPGILKPIKAKNRILVDGGTVNPLPYDIIRNDCDYTIAIDVSGVREPSGRKEIPTIFESLMMTFELLEHSLIEEKMKISKPDLYVKPAIINIDLLDFHKIDRIRESINDDVRKFRNNIIELLNLSSSSLLWRRLEKKLKNQ